MGTALIIVILPSAVLVFLGTYGCGGSDAPLSAGAVGASPGAGSSAAGSSGSAAGGVMNAAGPTAAARHRALQEARALPARARPPQEMQFLRPPGSAKTWRGSLSVIDGGPIKTTRGFAERLSAAPS